MTTKRGILTLAQWLSPSFPVGAFAYSHGLESAIESGVVASANDLQTWLTEIISYGSGRNDCILLRAAHACCDPAELAMVSDTGRAFASSAERLLETQRQGVAFGKTTAAIWGGDQGDYIYPVAVGAAASHQGIDATLTASMFLHAIAGNLVSAAMRLMALGQTEGQAVVASLMPLCQDIAAQTENTSLDDLHSTVFLADIAAMHHETLQPRIFRS